MTTTVQRGLDTRALKARIARLVAELERAQKHLNKVNLDLIEARLTLVKHEFQGMIGDRNGSLS